MDIHKPDKFLTFFSHFYVFCAVNLINKHQFKHNNNSEYKLLLQASMAKFLEESTETTEAY